MVRTHLLTPPLTTSAEPLPLRFVSAYVGGMTDLSPREIVSELDRFIVGQHDAKRAVAVALRNRWRRKRAPEDIRDIVTGLIVNQFVNVPRSHWSTSFKVACST